MFRLGQWMFFTLLIVVIVLLVSGCNREARGCDWMDPTPCSEQAERMRQHAARSKRIAEANVQAIENCVKAGGIPIKSDWDGNIEDCKFVREKR